MLAEAPGFVCRNLDNGAVLGRAEIGCLHRASVVEMTERREGLEIGRLNEAEVMRVDAENIVHHHPFILADTLPGIRSLARARLCINPLITVLVA